MLTRPRDLTRRQLRELALELDKAGYSETNLATAWRELTNQEIAARIVGYIRQAAMGDRLTPYDQRVDHALQKILADHPGARRSASGFSVSPRRPKPIWSWIAKRSTIRTRFSSEKAAGSSG